MLDPLAQIERARGEHADALLVLEQSQITARVDPIEAEIQRLLQQAGVGWVKAFGALDADATPGELLAILSALKIGLGALPLDQLPLAVLAGLPEAFRLGARQADESIKGKRTAPTPTMPLAERKGVLDVGASLLGKIAAAGLILTPVAVQRFGWRRVVAGVAQASQVVGIAKALIATQTHAAANRGALAVTEAKSLGRIWVPERDGCNRCQSFAGSVAGPGERFAPGPYFGDGSAPEPTRNPPLHPHCRCRFLAIKPGSDAAREMTAALQREARRTVAKGWTEAGGESNAAALRATERLLKAGARLPKSVVREAELAVGRGGFVQRRVP